MNSLLVYLVSKSEAEISNQIICEYLKNVLGRDCNYLELDLPEFVCWKINHQGESYCKAGRAKEWLMMLYERLWYLEYECRNSLYEIIKRLNRSFSSCRVAHDKVNKAFFRVLYKDWESGRWDGAESELARIVLSASKPYALLIIPRHWNENNGVLIDYMDEFQKLEEEVQKLKIKELLEVRVADDIWLLQEPLLTIPINRS